MFYSNSELILHFESIPISCLSMRNFEKWNSSIVDLIDTKSTRQSHRIKFDSPGAISSNIYFTHFIYNNVYFVFFHDNISNALIASIYDIFIAVFNNVMEFAKNGKLYSKLKKKKLLKLKRNY